LYAAAAAEAASEVHVYRRSLDDGTISLRQTFTGVAGVRAVAASPDGRFVYAAAINAAEAFHSDWVIGDTRLLAEAPGSPYASQEMSWVEIDPATGNMYGIDDNGDLLWIFEVDWQTGNVSELRAAKSPPTARRNPRRSPRTASTCTNRPLPLT
jgi:6-phosphogluconolactonase (cycloisomerase 2 family)